MCVCVWGGGGGGGSQKNDYFSGMKILVDIFVFLGVTTKLTYFRIILGSIKMENIQNGFLGGGGRLNFKIFQYA